MHGKGNAWPVPLGETHPYYDRTRPEELSNAAFSLEVMEGRELSGSILVDAGHGTIQSLLGGSNRIPDCVCLTHGHMDHTLSVDWIVQSYWRKVDQRRPYPIYASRPVQKVFLQSYPHLAGQVDFRTLEFGKQITLEHDSQISLTAYPVYHGQGAYGASMLLFKLGDRSLLFTGDLLTPLLRKADYPAVRGVDMLVVDTNNRFPWPRTNHWSFAGDPGQSPGRSEVMANYFRELSWEQLILPFELQHADAPSKEYFKELETEWPLQKQPFTMVEFLRHAEPRSVMPVHYSGAEDLKYHHKAILGPAELAAWVRKESRAAGLKTQFVFPNAGDVLRI